MSADIFIALGISLGLNLCFFLIAFWLKSDLFTDITYALTFLLTTLIIMIINKSYGTTEVILLVLITLWSLRLGTFLLIRIWKTKVDHRFDNMRSSFVKFGGFWLLQALTVWIVNMPTYLAIINPVGTFEYGSIVVIAFALIFLGWETIADLQKSRFTKKHPGQFINRGLWSISRHPNYFGEYSFWWMICAFVLINHWTNLHLVALVGPLYITFSLYMLSGVPILEKSGLKMFGHDQNYIQYLKNTPCVIPWVGKKGYKQKWKS